jgi:UDP-galactopyranose mutase
VPLHQLLDRVYQRYHRPLFMAETSHFGAGRGRWITEIASEVCLAHSIGVPLEGICIYPIIDRPDWQDLNHWHNSGLWDLVPGENGQLQRVLVQDYAEDLRRAQEMVNSCATREHISTAA